MPLSAFEDFAAEPLAFPIGGKVYTVPPIGMVEGLRLQAAIEGKDQSLADQPPEVLWRLVLGPVWDEMLADNVPAEAAARAAFTALADFQHGRQAAAHVWESGLPPEALAAPEAANRAQRRTQARAAKKATSSRSTAGAVSTRSRASSSGMRTPRQS